MQLDKAGFLAQVWQRHPQLIPAAFPDFSCPVSPDELAGLALEDCVESRIVDCRDGEWSVRHGPFSAAALQAEGCWTLLVQAVDHYIDAVAALRRQVDFIPQWRIDDVMVSYGTEGSSVGPHFDNYDVFLVQGQGTKQWRIGQHCDADSKLLPHPELRLLAEFDTREEYLLRPGDILYVPPGIAHWGIARSDSVTLSIGFRAPRVNDLLSRWLDEELERMDADVFHCDRGRPVAVNDGEITAQDRERILRQLRDYVLTELDTGRRENEAPRSDRWLGELLTEPRYEQDVNSASDDDALHRLREGNAGIRLRASAKLAWQGRGDTLMVFANGDSMPLSECALPFVQELCANWRLCAGRMREFSKCPDAESLLRFLLHCGSVDVD